MMTFKDMTFCSSDCILTTCRRYFSEQKQHDADKWWGPDKGEAPVAFSDFSDTCLDYKKETTDEPITSESTNSLNNKQELVLK